MDASSTNNSKIEKAMLTIQTLRGEYDTLLKQYQEAMNNHINTISSSTADTACINYTLNSKNISQICYDKIWQDQGCITNAPNVNENDTLSDLIKSVYDTSTSNKDDDKKTCYGTTNATVSSDKKIVYPNEKQYERIEGKTWWGTDRIEDKSLTTAEECIALCESTKNCSGATFNPDKKMCWTRKGDGGITDGMTTDFALVKKQKNELDILKKLNKKLISLNKQIIEKMNEIEPYVKSTTETISSNKHEINTFYDTLLAQQSDIDKQLSEYNDIQSQYENETLFVTQQHWLYNIFSILAIIIFVITAKKIMESDNNITIIITIGVVWAIYLFIFKMRKS